MTSAAHVHAVTAEVERMKQMYPGAKVTTDDHHSGTRIRVYQEPIGCVDARFVPFKGDE